MAIKEFFSPRSVAEALAKKLTSPEKNAFVAGGTDLLIEEHPPYDVVIDLKALPLHYIKREGSTLRIGATTTLAAVETSEELARTASGFLTHCARDFASIQIRNMATVGGNIVSAVPSADIVLPLLVLEAQVRCLAQGEKERVIPLKDFFTAPHQSVLGSDLLLEVIFPVPASRAVGRFFKIGRNPGDIAQINGATLVEHEKGVFRKVRIALGAVAPTPFRALRAEKYLEGKKTSTDELDRAAQMAAEETKPISDQRAVAEYRRRMSYVLTKRALLESVA